MFNTIFRKKFLCSIENKLNYIQILKDWSCIFVQGTDSKKYLQGQLTIDMFSFNNDLHKISGQCNFHGKLLSIIRLFAIENNFVCIVRKSIENRVLLEFKKYSMFSNINIIKSEEMILLGATGLNIKEFLKNYFSILPNSKKTVIQVNEVSILWIGEPIERFLLLMPLSVFIFFKKKFVNQIRFIDFNYWKALDIASGFPILDEKMIFRFLPKSFNLDFLKAIDFNKGCYIGQENIAKNHFLNCNKKKMYWLIGNRFDVPKISSELNVYKDKNFFYIGVILSVLKINDNTIWIQAILNNKVNENSIIYIDHDLKFPFFIFKSIFYNIN